MPRDPENDDLNLDIGTATAMGMRHSAEIAVLGVSFTLFCLTVAFPSRENPALRVLLDVCTVCILLSTLLSIVTITAARRRVHLKPLGLNLHTSVQEVTFPVSIALASTATIGITIICIAERSTNKSA